MAELNAGADGPVVARFECDELAIDLVWRQRNSLWGHVDVLIHALYGVHLRLNLLTVSEHA